MLILKFHDNLSTYHFENNISVSILSRDHEGLLRTIIIDWSLVMGPTNIFSAIVQYDTKCRYTNYCNVVFNLNASQRAENAPRQSCE